MESAVKVFNVSAGCQPSKCMNLLNQYYKVDDHQKFPTTSERELRAMQKYYGKVFDEQDTHS